MTLSNAACAGALMHDSLIWRHHCSSQLYLPEATGRQEKQLLYMHRAPYPTIACGLSCNASLEATGHETPWQMSRSAILFVPLQ